MDKIGMWLCRCGGVMLFVFALHEILSGRDTAIDVFAGFFLSVALIGGLDFDD